MERSLYWYKGSLPILKLQPHHQTCCKKIVVFSLFNRAYSIITNKDDLFKESARIKQVLTENGYQESILVQSLRELPAITACLCRKNKRKPQITKTKKSE